MASELILLQESSGRYINRSIPPVTSGLDANVSPSIQATVDARVLIYSTALTANRAITCSNTSSFKGARFRIVRSDNAAFTVEVKDHDGNILKTIPSATPAWVDVVHNGTSWLLCGYGVL